MFWQVLLSVFVIATTNTHFLTTNQENVNESNGSLPLSIAQARSTKWFSWNWAWNDSQAKLHSWLVQGIRKIKRLCCTYHRRWQRYWKIHRCALCKLYKWFLNSNTGLPFKLQAREGADVAIIYHSNDQDADETKNLVEKEVGLM